LGEIWGKGKIGIFVACVHPASNWELGDRMEAAGGRITRIPRQVKSA
jgi:hypothetical protein